MAKRLQELSLLHGTPRGQARLLIKDNPTGFLEDYSISVNDFKSDLIFANEVSANPTIDQIPRLINTDGVPALPAISAKNLLHIEATLPSGNGTTQGLLRLSDSITSTSGVSGGIAATPLAIRQLNIAKPNITGATITGAWTFTSGATFNAATITGTATLGEVQLNGNIVSNKAIIIATTGNTSDITIAAGNNSNTALTLENNGNFTVRGNVISNRAPTVGNHLANKEYVDRFDSSLSNNLVHKSGSETITGTKKFTSTVTVEVERVALELKASDEVNSVIVDYGNHASDFVVRNEVMLPNSNEHGQIKFTHANNVPQENREMYINNNMVWHQGNDGIDSGLDADLLDGKQSGLYVQTDEVQTITAQKTFAAQTNFNSTVNFNTDLVNLQPAGGNLTPVLKFSGQGDESNNIGYIQFENRNGGAVGSPTATRRDLSVSDTFDLNWGGNRLLTVLDEGAGNGLDADTLDGLHASDFVNLTGSQNVNGNKTFGNKVTINNSVNSNKQFEITGGTPTINLSPTGTSPHYRIQVSGNGNFNILSDTNGDENFNSTILGFNRGNEQVFSYGKQLLNVADNFDIDGSFTFDRNARINLNSTNHYLGTSNAGSPILSSTGGIQIVANSDNSVENETLVLRSATNGMFCAISPSQFSINTNADTILANFNNTAASSTSFIRLTGRKTANSADSVARIEGFNSVNNVGTSLLFKADRTLEYTGVTFTTTSVDCTSVGLRTTSGSSIPSLGDLCFVSNFNGSASNETPSALWATGGGGLLLRTEEGLAGVIDSRNMTRIAPTFRGLSIGTGGFNINSLANFEAGNRNYITTRNINDAAVNLSDSDIVNVNGLHFSSGSSGITFFKGGLPNLASSYSSLLIDETGVRYRSDSSSTNDQYCAMISREAGLQYWSLTPPNNEGFLRTPVSGLLPYAPTGDDRSTSNLGTSAWRFRQAHVNVLFCYEAIVLDRDTEIVTPQYSTPNETFLNMRGRSSLSVGGFVNSSYLLQSDDSGSGFKIQSAVTPTGSLGNDNMFSVKASDGAPKLYVGSQRTGTQNPNFYVGVDNNGSGGRRVIHEGDGGRLLASESVI